MRVPFSFLGRVLATLFLAATALAAPADTTATSSSTETTDSDDSYDLADVPSSIMTVLATAIPASWYNDIMDPASRSSIVSEAEAGTYPAWYNALPSSVKAWATSNFADQIAGATATDSSATQTETAGSSAVETGSTTASSQASSNAAEITSASTTTSSSSSDSTSSSASSSDSSSSSTSASPSSSQSTGGAPAPTGGIAMGVAGAAGVLALALAL
ncbi:unnamed protein product [Penicillium crustosum]